jgi:quercetin dioxygenase-like cupin family protein
LAEITLPSSVSTVGFFHPTTPPRGTMSDHWHEGLTEFMYFLKPGKLKVGKESYDISAGDMVMLSPGEPHEVLGGPEGVNLFVIKLPNNPKDVKRE